MQYLRCKCGKCEYFSSGMWPQDCEGCEECGTTYSWKPEGHEPLAPHDWQPQFDRNTGKPDRPICRKCFKRKRDWKSEETTLEGKPIG